MAEFDNSAPVGENAAVKKLVSGLPGFPPAIGPYSSAVIAEGKFAFVSGTLPYCHETKGIVRGSIAEQTELTLKNLKAIVEGIGATMNNVVNCKVYIQPFDQDSFKAMNEVYARYFGESKPSRSTIGVQLPNADIEIDCIVQLP